MSDPLPTPPAAPLQPADRRQQYSAQAVTIVTTIVGAWLVKRGVDDSQATEYADVIAGLVVAGLGWVGAHVWGRIQRQNLAARPAPTQVVPPAAPPAPPKITIDVAKLTELIEPMVAKALDDTLKRRLDPLFPPQE